MSAHRTASYILCPECGSKDNGVADTRSNDKPRGIYRRRVCKECGLRFTTYEITEEDFDRIKNNYIKMKTLVERMMKKNETH